MWEKSMKSSLKSADEPDRPNCVDVNVAALIGTLSSDPANKTLPSGDTVLSYEVTCRVQGREVDSVPVSWMNAPKRTPAVAKGDRVIVVGHARRRFFRAGGATASRTEIVATRVARITSSSRSATALALRAAADEINTG
jgi:single-strand DNA-binding protein